MADDIAEAADHIEGVESDLGISGDVRSIPHKKDAQLPEPELRLRFRDREVPLKISSAQVDVTLVGCLVEVEQTLTFRSQEDSRCGGDLIIPLPESAVVCGFAVGNDAESLVQAQIVQKQAASVAFEDAVRKQEPLAALIEKTGATTTAGRLYRTRIWPVEPQATKVVRLTYTDTLRSVAPITLIPHAEGGNSPSSTMWALPFLTALDLLATAACCQETRRAVASATFSIGLPYQSAERLEVRVHVLGDTSPVALPSGLPLEFSAALDSNLQSMAQWAGCPQGDTPLAVAIPEMLYGRAQVWVERNGPDLFWLAYDSPVAKPIQAEEEGSVPEAREIKHLGIAWDGSFSRDCGESRTADLKLLEDLLSQFKGLVSCLCFDVDTEWLQPAGASGEAKIQALLQAINARPCDGGTRFSALDFGCCKCPGVSERIDGWLLFTDGVGSVGSPLPLLDGAPPIFVVSQNTSAPILRELASATGGSVCPGSTTAEALLQKMLTPTFGFQGTKESQGLLDCYPNRPVPVENGERLLLVGRLEQGLAHATLRPQYGVVGGAASSSRHLRIEAVSATTVPDSACSPVARLWAKKCIDALEGLTSPSRAAESLRLARRYGVVTTGASLMVLSSMEEYMEHGLVPGEGQPTLREEYMQKEEAKRQAELKRQSEKLADVGTRWKARVDWWETDRSEGCNKLITRSTPRWSELVARRSAAFAEQVGGEDGELAIPHVLALLEDIGLRVSEVEIHKLGIRSDQLVSKRAFESLSARIAALRAFRILDPEASGVVHLSELASTSYWPLDMDVLPWLSEEMKVAYRPVVLNGHRLPLLPRAASPEAAPIEFVEQAIALFQSAFTDVDSTGNGRISIQQLAAAVKALRLPPACAKDDKIVHRIAFNDFLQLMNRRLNGSDCRRYSRQPEYMKAEMLEACLAHEDCMAAVRCCGARSAHRAVAHIAPCAAPMAEMDAAAVMNAESEEDGPASQSSMQLKGWDPDKPYLKVIKEARSVDGNASAYQAYLSQRAAFQEAPSFFLDVAAYFFAEAAAGQAPELRQIGARILSSALELGVEEPQLLRLVAYGLEAGGRLTLAEQVFEDVLRLRPTEPQSHRDLANLLARKWKAKYFPEGDPDVCSDEGFAAYSDSAACRDAARSFEL
eukprot:TRINITY_DN32070_c0_g1_i1.p1 TRINITY_DN32070_c0_g1~~TRINITY_DN32070_c0_g1_i1.p1  ORF type:complete len:1153 (+),score=198.61 TRINITY_DN32070_c0_g1_i1:25-3459(+)